MNAKVRKEIAKHIDALNDIRDTLESIRDDEEEKYDNMPEGLQDSERANEMAQNQEQKVTMTMQWKSTLSEVLSNPLYERFLAPPKLESTPIVSIAEQDGEIGVRLCVGDIDIFIEAHDLDDGKKYEWPDAMKRLKKVGKDTFNKHQSYFIAAFKDEINEKMREIGGKELDDGYWSSTECTSDTAWVVNFPNGGINGYGGNLNTFAVRPVAAFKKN